MITWTGHEDTSVPEFCDTCGEPLEIDEDGDIVIGEDHELTDCPHCERTYQRCTGSCPRCGFTWADDV